MSRYLLPLVLVGLIGCVTPASSPQFVQASRPAFEAVSVTGLNFWDERLASRSEEVATGYGLTRVGKSYAYGSGWGVGKSATFESFDNTSLREALRLAIEDAKVARRVVSKASVRIEGRVLGSENRSGVGRLLYDLFISLPTLGILPWIGVTETAIELRVYHDDELIRTFTGTGRANWSAPFLGWIAAFERQAAFVAGELAVKDAVGQIAAQADEIAAKVIPDRRIAPARPASTEQPASESLCGARSRDAASQRRCQHEQNIAYGRLQPAIARVRENPASGEATALKQCYGAAQYSHGTLGRHLKTGQTSTSQNRPMGARTFSA